MPSRKVVVAMPFGRVGTERRKAILNFTRLKYIIQDKCQTVPSGSRTTGMRVVYDVEVTRSATTTVPQIALERIGSADILIALLSEPNQAVAYELGYGRARERTVILMVDSGDDVVPVYESATAYLEWRQDDVLRHIDSIAGMDFPPLDDFYVRVPSALKEVIDARDHQLIQNLELALQEIENVRGEFLEGVFITYRRDDQAGFAGRLVDRLAERFGKEKIFRDVDSMRYGHDFRKVIEEQLAQCKVMLVVIGRNWLNAETPNGLRRLDDPDDIVRLEIAAGLAREDVRVIPILVDGASVPKTTELPDSLRGLADRHGHSMSNSNFHGDLEMLLTQLKP